jgi:hypothetical protein
VKYLFLLFFMLAAPGSYGRKDPCKRITMVTDNKTGALTQKSPDLKDITVIKQFRTDTFFALLLHFTDSREHFEKYGASIEFEDGTVITDEDVRVVCKQETSMLMSGSMSPGGGASGRYMLQGFFRITDEHAAKFMLQRIKAITLHNAIRPIPRGEADRVMDLVRCMK